MGVPVRVFAKASRSLKSTYAFFLIMLYRQAQSWDKRLTSKGPTLGSLNHHKIKDPLPANYSFQESSADNGQKLTDTETTDQQDEAALIRYSQQSDFRRGIIKGSIRAQRRKLVIWKPLKNKISIKSNKSKMA